MHYQRAAAAPEDPRIAPAYVRDVQGTRFIIGHDMDMKWWATETDTKLESDEIVVCCHGKDLPMPWRRQHITGTAHQYNIFWEHPEMNIWVLVLRSIKPTHRK